MASGRIHSLSSVGVATGSLAVFLIKLYPLDYFGLLAIPVGAIMAILFSPDMDVDNGYIGNHYVRQLFGNKIEWLYDTWKRPFSIAVAHRHWLSHGLIIGTIVRYLYLCFPISAILYPNTQKFDFFNIILSQLMSIFPCVLLFYMYNANSVITTNILIGGFFGFLLSDLNHIMSDKTKYED